MRKRELSYEIIKDLDGRLGDIPVGDLPRIYNELNSHRWSPELGEPPADYKKRVVCPETIYLLNEIKHRCGIKAVWRYIKTEEENFTPQMFEDWWDSTFLGGEPSYEFYERLGEKNSREQSQNCKNHTYYVLCFLLGFLFSGVFFLFVKFCT